MFSRQRTQDRAEFPLLPAWSSQLPQEHAQQELDCICFCWPSPVYVLRLFLQAVEAFQFTKAICQTAFSIVHEIFCNRSNPTCSSHGIDLGRSSSAPVPFLFWLGGTRRNMRYLDGSHFVQIQRFIDCRLCRRGIGKSCHH